MPRPEKWKKIKRLSLLASLVLAAGLGLASQSWAGNFWLENFTGGTPYTTPSNWFDDTAIIRYDGVDGYADVSQTAAIGYGGVNSIHQVSDLNVYPTLEVKITTMVNCTVVIQVFLASNLSPVPDPLVQTNVRKSMPGDYFFDVPTMLGLTGPQDYGVRITVEGTQNNAYAVIQFVRIFGPDTPTVTNTATFTQTPTSTQSATFTQTPSISPTLTQSATFTPTPTISFTPSVSATQTQSPTQNATATASATQTSTPFPTYLYFEDFLGGTAGAQPPGWLDATNGIQPPAEMNYTATSSFAAVTLTSSAGYGGVESPTSSVNLNVYNKLQFTLTSLQQGAASLVVQVFDPANPTVVYPAGSPTMVTRVFTAGTYIFDIPTLMGGVIGTQPRNLAILVTLEGPQGSVATLDSIGIFTYSLVLTGSATPTPTPVPSSTAVVSQGFIYFDDFLGGTAGVQPPGWLDNTDGIGPAAEINYTAINSYAAVTVTNAGGFGSVQSMTITADVSVYSKIQWKIVDLQQGAASMVVQLFDPAAPAVLYPASSPTMVTRVFAAGTYTFDIPTLMGNNIGTQPRNLSIKVTVEGSQWAYVTLDSIGIFTTSAIPTLTPSPTPSLAATPVTNDFRPSVNLFRSRSGPMKFIYTLSSPDTVSIVVYTINGRKVRTLQDGPVNAIGTAEVVWDGKNESGDAVANGVYIIWLQSGQFSKKVRVAVVK